MFKGREKKNACRLAFKSSCNTVDSINIRQMKQSHFQTYPFISGHDQMFHTIHSDGDGRQKLFDFHCSDRNRKPYQ